jgi:hypothetical protein
MINKKNVAILLLLLSVLAITVDAHDCGCDGHNDGTTQCVAPCCINLSKVPPAIIIVDVSYSPIQFIPLIHEQIANSSSFIKTIFRPPRSL